MDLEFFVLLAVFIPILAMYLFMVRLEGKKERRRVMATRELVNPGQLPNDKETKL